MSAALTAREEQAAKCEAEAALEQALAALAKQVKRGQAEAPATSGISNSTTEVISLEEQLQIARDELETVVAERWRIQGMHVAERWPSQ